MKGTYKTVRKGQHYEKLRKIWKKANKHIVWHTWMTHEEI